MSARGGRDLLRIAQKHITKRIFIASSGLKSGKYNGNIMAVVTGEDLFARQAH